MSLGKAQKHMQRAAELLNQGELEFGRAQRKTKTKPKKTKKKPESPLQKEGITCYADSNILEMLESKLTLIQQLGCPLHVILRLVYIHCFVFLLIN